jgi:hypothetical protein
VNDKQKATEIQQLVDQRITAMIGSQAAYIARLESQVIIMEKEISELQAQIPKDNQVAEEPKPASTLKAVSK